MKMDYGDRRLIDGQRRGGTDEDDWDTEGGGRGGGGGGGILERLHEAPMPGHPRAWSPAPWRFLALALLAANVLALLTTITATVSRTEQCSPAHQKPENPIYQVSASANDAVQEGGAIPSTGILVTAPRGNQTIGTYLAWNSEMGNTYCTGGFRYENGSLVVPRDGFYLINLQITYEYLSTQPSEAVRLEQTVLIFRPEYKQDTHLLTVVDTVDGGMKQWSRSLHTQGTFSLSANSKLHVTSRPELLKFISRWPSLVFFSAHRLP